MNLADGAGGGGALAGEEAVGADLGEGSLGGGLVAAVHDAGLELAEGLVDNSNLARFGLPRMLAD